MGVIAGLNLLPAHQWPAEFGAGRMEDGSRIACARIEKVDAGGKLADLVNDVIALEIGCAVFTETKVA